MPRKRETSPDVDREICLLVEQGFRTPADVLRRLKEDNRFVGDWPVVGEKTIGNRMRECRLLDDSSPWSLLDDEPDAARRVIPVFTWAFGETYGRVWLSQAVAAWVARVCAVADLPPDWAWAFAKAYQWAAGRKEDSRCLDVLLMRGAWKWTPWSTLEVGLADAECRERHLEACRLASPATWEAQWDDLLGFWLWSAYANMLPPWADDGPGVIIRDAEELPNRGDVEIDQSERSIGA